VVKQKVLIFLVGDGQRRIISLFHPSLQSGKTYLVKMATLLRLITGMGVIIILVLGIIET
jgi:hypothetical protein